MTNGVLLKTGDMDQDFFDDVHNFPNGVMVGGVLVPSNDTASLKAANETISGDKNHTGALQKDGADVATMDDISGLPVVPQSGGGILTANRINQIRDGNTGYFLPLAASTEDGIQLTIELPSRYSSGNSPEISVSNNGTDDDTITDVGGVDPNGNIRLLGDSSPNGIRITLTSDGISNWSL